MPAKAGDYKQRSLITSNTLDKFKQLLSQNVIMGYMIEAQKSQIKIELAHEDDIDEIEAIENRAFPFPWSRNVLLGEINGESFSYVYVARLQERSGEAGKIIGYHFFWLVADEVHILNIAVDPAYQGYGIGKQLMQFAIDFGRERGATSVLLEVRVSNTAAQELYASLGFRQIGIRKKYYSENKEDAYVMKKEIFT